MTIIDGKKIAQKVFKEVEEEVLSLSKTGLTPGLAVVIVGDDPASQAYVGSKVRTCKKVGVYSKKIALPKRTSQEELLAVIKELNEDSAIHGILVQSPPPPHINEEDIVKAIDPRKDVDGFHPDNVAKLALEDPSGFAPCTPLGCLRLLKEYQIETEGAHVVIVGRSMIVGKTLGLLLIQNKSHGGNATVTIAHSRTKNLEAICQQADIVIAAVGVPHLLNTNHVNKNTIVIDVGINRVEDTTLEKGYRLVGDVDFNSVSKKCQAITPVPGGVGPMTIAMLLQNTVKACRLQNS